MKYTVEKPLSRFEFWSGAITTASNLDEDEFDRVEQGLESDCHEYTDVEINDLFWFESDYIYELAGKTKAKIDYEYDDNDDITNTDVTYFVYEDYNESEHVFESKSIEECREYCRNNYVLWENK